MPYPYDQLTSFRELLQQTSLFDALTHIAETLKSTLSAERASVLIYERDQKLLWTVVHEEKEKIVVPYDQGIVGETLRTGKVQIENEPYDNVNFFAEVDMQLEFYTQSILAIPIFNTNEKIIGVIELLNKPGGFTKEDREYITHFTNSISGYIEENAL